MHLHEALAKTALKGRAAARAILGMVCEDYGVTKNEIRSLSRSKTIVAARIKAICLMMEVGVSSEEAGMEVNRDSSVVRRHYRYGKKSASVRRGN